MWISLCIPFLNRSPTYAAGMARGSSRPCLIDVPDEGRLVRSVRRYQLLASGTRSGSMSPIRDFDPTSVDRTPDLARERATVDRHRAGPARA